MTQQTQGELITNIRQAVRSLMTHALDDEWQAASSISRTLGADPEMAAAALMELGEALDIALHGAAAVSGHTANEVWRRICARLAEQDDQVAASYETTRED